MLSVLSAYSYRSSMSMIEAVLGGRENISMGFDGEGPVKAVLRFTLFWAGMDEFLISLGIWIGAVAVQFCFVVPFQIH